MAKKRTLYRAVLMNIDYSKLQERYANMSEEQFSIIKREDLTEQARFYYDQEKMRRTPGWKYEEPIPPTPEMKTQALITLRRRRQSRFIIGTCCLLAIMVVLGLLRVFPTYLLLLGICAFSMNLKRGGHLVVWLRRFHKRERGGLRFRYFLSTACNGVGLPITIQDSSFRSSSLWAFAQFIPYYPVLILLVGVFVVGVVWGERYSDRSLLDALFLVYGVSVLLTIVLIWRRLGHKTLRASNARQWILNLVQNIRTGRGRYDDVVVVKCGDDFWRDTVSTALENADAVIVDVTEPSETIVWELQTALRRMRQECILLACAANTNTTNQLPTHVNLKLQSVIDEPTLNKMPRFFYPSSRGWLEWLKLMGLRFGNQSVKELGYAIIRCVSYSNHENMVRQ